MTTLPPIDQSLMPADVRRGSEEDRKTYTAALGFERTLVLELAKVMAETAKPEDDGTPQDAATAMYQQMLPEQLADSVTQAGSLGLAQPLYRTLKQEGK